MKKLITLLPILFLMINMNCSESTKPEKEPVNVLVVGEVQDATLMSQAITGNPQISEWSAREQYDQVTGATLQYKYFDYDLPACNIYLDDELIAVADAFGQFSFDAFSGTHSLKTVCEGYKDSVEELVVEEVDKVYIAIVLSRE